MGTAHTLARQFFWYENVLWKEDLSTRPTSVFLSANDAIVNAAVIREYLTDTGKIKHGVSVEQRIITNGHKRMKAAEQRVFRQDWDDQKPHVIWGDGLDHGQMFDIAAWRDMMRAEVLTLSRLGHSKFH